MAGGSTNSVCKQPWNKRKGKLYIKYLHQAIELEKSGLKVDFKKTTEFTVPELERILLSPVAALERRPV